MVIITADDYGKTRHCTDSILECFFNNRITSASAMVFMEDSERAAGLSSKTGMEVGLHLNFTMPFSSPNVAPVLRDHLAKVISYLTRNKLTQAIYNPFLANAFKYLFLSQHEEFKRLYGRNPDFYNGHHHMHLCANVLLDRLIPNGSRVRTTFTFDKGEKDPFNRLFRSYISGVVSGRFISTDHFFSINPLSDIERLHRILECAAKCKVEIEVHPEHSEERDFLMSDQCRELLSGVHMDGYQKLTATK